MQGDMGHSNRTNQTEMVVFISKPGRSSHISARDIRPINQSFVVCVEDIGETDVS